ncbi:MAG: hypothetical protein IKZ88_05600, partial [Neisseriaceae bacterium]|nr:hypothetical protein [Neisseriaceae bacterium]
RLKFKQFFADKTNSSLCCSTVLCSQDIPYPCFELNMPKFIARKMLPMSLHTCYLCYCTVQTRPPRVLIFSGSLKKVTVIASRDLSRRGNPLAVQVN